jgi:hypothetical protein
MTVRRASTRTMLAHVALAADLPMPRDVYFHEDSLTLGFDLLSSASAWCKFLGGKEQAPGEKNGNRYFRDDLSIRWHGWQIYLTASESIKTVRAVPALPANVTEDLSSLVSADQVAA